MSNIEKFNTLLENEMTEENIQSILDLFAEDSHHHSALIEELYPFFLKQYTKMTPKVYKLFADNATSYLKQNPSYDKQYGLVFIILMYLYAIGDYSQAISLISKLNDLSTPDSFLLAAYEVRFNILRHLNMDDEASETLFYILKSKFFQNTSDFAKGVLYSNAVTMYANLKNKKNTLFYYGKMLQHFKAAKGLEADVLMITNLTSLFVDIVLTRHGLLGKDLNNLAEQFYDFILHTKLTLTSSGEDSTPFLTILESLDGYLTEEQEYNICVKIIFDTAPLSRGLINYYSYLFEKNNKYYDLNDEMKQEHTHALYDFYKTTQNNYVSSLKETLRLQMVEEKLNKMETNYNLDMLTQCYNRNLLKEVEGNDFSEGCVLYFDLDELKAINDSFGHRNGDAYISAFAKLLLKLFCEENEQVFRYGGDEFVVIIQNTTLQTCLLKVDRLAKVTDRTRKVSFGSAPICFSCGIYYAQEKISIKKAVELADRAMYDCKNKRKTNLTCYYKIAE